MSDPELGQQYEASSLARPGGNMVWTTECQLLSGACCIHFKPSTSGAIVTRNPVVENLSLMLFPDPA